MKGGITLTEGKKEEEKIQDCLKKKAMRGKKRRIWKHWGQDNCISDVAVEGIVLPKRSAVG